MHINRRIIIVAIIGLLVLVGAIVLIVHLHSKSSASTSCKPGFAGPNCKYSDKQCIGHGKANYVGTCDCDSGFAGQFCQFSNDVTCSGHGVAQNDGTCICNKPYVGPACA